MAKQVKLIFGIETSQSTVVNIEATIDHDAPQLTVITRNGNGGQVSYNGGKWTTTLGTGQHILVIEATTEDEWFEDKPAFELSQNAKIVVHLSTSNSTTYTKAWQDDDGQAANPKDPWPPPKTPLVSLSDASWFAAELSDWYANIANARGSDEILEPPPRPPAVPVPG